MALIIVMPVSFFLAKSRNENKILRNEISECRVQIDSLNAHLARLEECANIMEENKSKQKDNDSRLDDIEYDLEHVIGFLTEIGY